MTMAKIYGIEVGELPEGWQAMRVIVVVECFDNTDDRDGANPFRLISRSSPDLQIWTAIGMMMGILNYTQEQLADHLSAMDDDDNEPD